MLSQRYINDGKERLILNETQKQAKINFINKNYPLEYVNCLCGNNEYDILCEKDRYGLEYRLVLCKNCGMVYNNPRITQEGYNEFYDNEYRLLYSQAEIPTDNFFYNQVESGHKILDYLSDLFADKNSYVNKNVLEIGCGAGGILAPFKEKGAKELGIDLGSQYINYGKELGLNLIQMNSSELAKTCITKFDLIILSHVLEHFLDIEYELSIIHKLLSSNGLLYIEVPGILETHNNYMNDFLCSVQNAHTYYFTLETLQQTLNKSGFAIVKGNECIRSVFKKSNTSDTNTKNYYDKVNNYLISLEKKSSSI